MTEATPAEPAPDAPAPKDDHIGRFLSVSILSRFMRITYGAQAIPETQRRIEAYAKGSKHDLAEIWQRVLARLTGCDPSTETRMVVKAKRSLKVRP
jgi:hypothetical protein